jgi:hypothetical protein
MIELHSHRLPADPLIRVVSSFIPIQLHPDPAESAEGRRFLKN